MGMREEARKVVDNHLLVSAGYALVTSPIPGTTVGVVGIETAMVYEIAKVYGYDLSPQEAASILGSLLGAGTVVKTSLNEALTFIPGFGYLVKAAVAGTSTHLLGKLAIQYFENKYKKDQGFA